MYLRFSTLFRLHKIEITVLAKSPVTKYTFGPSYRIRRGYINIVIIAQFQSPSREIRTYSGGVYTLIKIFMSKASKSLLLRPLALLLRFYPLSPPHIYPPPSSTSPYPFIFHFVKQGTRIYRCSGVRPPRTLAIGFKSAPIRTNFRKLIFEKR